MKVPSTRKKTCNTTNNNITANDNLVIVKYLGSCFNDWIDREMDNNIDTVTKKIQNEIFTAIDIIIAPKIEVVARPNKASSGQDATGVTANSERGERVEIPVPFENVSKGNNALHLLNANDETRKNIPDDVSELSVPGSHFDLQPHTQHMMTEQKARTDQFPEFLRGRMLTPRDPPSDHYQNLSTQISQHNNLPMVEQTLRNQNSDSNSSINRLIEAIVVIATQQKKPQAATILKPVSTNTLIFDGKNVKFKFFQKTIPHSP